MNKSKESVNFTSSLILILMIPVLIVAAFYYQMRNFNNLLSVELQDKAVLSANLIVDCVKNNLNNQTTVQNQINNYLSNNPQISEITVIQSVNNSLITLATTNTQLTGVNISGENYLDVWTSNKASTTIVKDTSENKRYITVITPISGADGKVISLVSVKMSLSNIDKIANDNMKFSVSILAVIVFLIILLLLNHFRLIGYAFSFRKLKEADKMKDDFISIASHELKTPMVTIQGYISMLLEGVAGKYDAKTKEHLLKIYNNIQKLDHLVSELLDVSRLEQGRLKFDMQPCDISKIVNGVMENYKDEATEKKIILEVQNPQNLPQVFVDPDRTRQIIDNIVGNAIKYTNQGSITISYQVVDSKVITIVKDTGIGMNEKDRKQLFTKFYRIKNEKTANISGTGLGLWLSKQMAKHQSGDITVASTENVGSEFSIILPFIKEK